MNKTTHRRTFKEAKVFCSPNQEPQTLLRREYGDYGSHWGHICARKSVETLSLSASMSGRQPKVAMKEQRSSVWKNFKKEGTASMEAAVKD